ncbi:MAG: hypothetical protein ACJ8F7_13050 [Gemmataceae bacterium]
MAAKKGHPPTDTSSAPESGTARDDTSGNRLSDRGGKDRPSGRGSPSRNDPKPQPPRDDPSEAGEEP